MTSWRAKQLGASATVNYRQHPEWQKEVLTLTDGRGVDHVIEVGGAGTLPRSIEAARLAGQIHQIGVLTGGGGQIDPSISMRKGLILCGIYVGSRQMFEAMNRAIAVNVLHPVIDRVFAFEQTAEAYRHMQKPVTSGQNRHKDRIRENDHYGIRHVSRISTRAGSDRGSGVRRLLRTG